jgi:peptidoglycan hydrolase CwlO-like protein
LRGQTTEDGVARLRKQDEKDMRRAQKLKRYHEIEMLKLEHIREKRRLKEEQASAETEKQALAGFDRVKFSHRIADFVAALCIAIFARKKSDAFLTAHLFRQHQKADSLYRASVIQSANRIQDASNKLRYLTKDLQHKLIEAESNHSFIDEVIERVDENISRFSKADEDEQQVKEIHDRWREVLQRPLFRESFKSFFEQNLDQWNRSLGQEQLKSAIQSENQQTDGQVTNGQPPSLWDRTSRRLWAYFSTALRPFLIVAAPAEIMFTYPIFLALSNGDIWAAGAGATVFTFGILTLGQVSGKSILRMRSRKPGPKDEPDVIKTEWRPLSVLAAIMLVLVASFGIYAGATLRQNAGEVLRISQEVQNLGAEIERTSARLERLQSDTTSNSEQISAVEARIARLEQNRATLMANREEIVRRTDSPFVSSEGRAALFIFGIFFLGSVASRL